jgi:predicted DNA binding CopG/RHH family protein
MRLRQPLTCAVKGPRGLPYQRLIREAIKRVVRR